ncbi:hypothetical protein SCANM63S_03205 [Streptomyces canarius]
MPWGAAPGRAPRAGRAGRAGPRAQSGHGDLGQFLRQLEVADQHGRAPDQPVRLGVARRPPGRPPQMRQEPGSRWHRLGIGEDRQDAGDRSRRGRAARRRGRRCHGGPASPGSDQAAQRGAPQDPYGEVVVVLGHDGPHQPGQQGGALGGVPHAVLQATLDPLDAGPLLRGGGPRGRRVQQPGQQVLLAGVHGLVGGLEQPFDPLTGLVAEACGLFQGEHGVGGTAPAVGAVGGGLQPVRKPRVGPDRGRRLVPGPAVGSGWQAACQGRVDLPAEGRGGRLPDRRAHQRVPEAHRVPGRLDQPGRDGGSQVRGRHRGSGTRRGDAQDLGERRAVVAGGREQDAAGRVRQGAQPSGERVLEPPRHRGPRSVGGDGLVPRGVGRQLGQRERVAGRFLQQLLAGHAGQAGRPLVQKEGGRLCGQRPHCQAGDVGAGQMRGIAVPHGGHQQDGLRFQAPGEEGEDLGAGPVEPVDVVHDEQQRCVGRGPCQQIQGGERHQEHVVDGCVRDAERRLERVPLVVRQIADQGPEREDELVQSGERQQRLRLHADRGQHAVPALCAVPCRLLQERGLPDSGFAVHENGAPLSGQAVDTVLQEGRLVLTAEQCVGGKPHRRHLHGKRPRN